MSDLEMVRLCAEAMGSSTWTDIDGNLYSLNDSKYEIPYDPLRDDAQAMALVRRLKPASLHYNVFAGKWSVRTLADNETGVRFEAFSADLNRAIVECCARMQSGKETI